MFPFRCDFFWFQFPFAAQYGDRAIFIVEDSARIDVAPFAQDSLVDDGIFFDDRPRHDDGIRNFRPFFDGDAVEDDRIADGTEDFRTFGDEGTLGRPLRTDEVRRETLVARVDTPMAVAQVDRRFSAMSPYCLPQAVDGADVLPVAFKGIA